MESFHEPFGSIPAFPERLRADPMPSIDPELLSLLACPESRQPLAEAGSELLEKVNAAIAAGGFKNIGGVEVGQALEAGLVREDGTIIYPVRDGIPVLLAEEGLAIPQA